MNDAPPPYSPSLVPPGLLDEFTVGQESLLATITRGLESVMLDGGARFEALVGPPGSGKTHLLRSIYARVEASAAAADAAFVLFPERSAVASLTDLLARTATLLHGANIAVDRAIDRARRLGGDDAVETLETLLDDLVDTRPLLIFIEHLDEILETSVEDQHRIRAMLQDRATWSIVTTGIRPSTIFTKASAPLFGTFTLRHLSPLSSAACHELRVRRASGSRPEPASTRTLHHLLGGWPRPIVIAQACASGAPGEDIEELIAAVCDAMEPELVFAERNLPQGRGAVFRVFASHDRPLTPSDIAGDFVGVGRNVVTAQLKILRDEGLLRSHPIGRSSYYELANATHRLVATRRAAPGRLSTFARFLYDWYSKNDDHGDLIADGGFASTPINADEALESCASAGLDPVVLDSLRSALRSRASDRRAFDQAMTDASHRYWQSNTAERLLLDQVLAVTDADGTFAKRLKTGNR